MAQKAALLPAHPTAHCSQGPWFPRTRPVLLRAGGLPQVTQLPWLVSGGSSRKSRGSRHPAVPAGACPLPFYKRKGFTGGSEVKASACNAGDLGSIPGSGRSPGEGNGNPLQPRLSAGRRESGSQRPWLGEAAPQPEGSSVCAQQAPARLGFPGSRPYGKCLL